MSKVYNLSNLIELENNEGMEIHLDIDLIPETQLLEKYNYVLSKLRHGGRLNIRGTSLNLFCKLVLNGNTELRNKLPESQSFYNIEEIENLVRQELNIENIWIENECFFITAERP